MKMYRFKSTWHGVRTMLAILIIGGLLTTWLEF